MPEPTNNWPSRMVNFFGRLASHWQGYGPYGVNVDKMKEETNTNIEKEGPRKDAAQEKGKC